MVWWWLAGLDWSRYPLVVWATNTLNWPAGVRMAVIYTDGSCLGNPGPGGWAAVVMWNGKTLKFCGHDPHTTNNRMEITAAVKGLEALPAGTDAIVYTDSRLVVNTMVYGWNRKVNQDLWAQLDRQVTLHHVDWRWVESHGRTPGNLMADRLARTKAENPRYMP